MAAPPGQTPIYDSRGDVIGYRGAPSTTGPGLALPNFPGSLPPVVISKPTPRGSGGGSGGSEAPATAPTSAGSDWAAQQEAARLAAEAQAKAQAEAQAKAQAEAARLAAEAQKALQASAMKSAVEQAGYQYLSGGYYTGSTGGMSSEQIKQLKQANLTYEANLKKGIKGATYEQNVSYGTQTNLTPDEQAYYDAVQSGEIKPSAAMTSKLTTTPAQRLVTPTATAAVNQQQIQVSNLVAPTTSSADILKTDKYGNQFFESSYGTRTDLVPGISIHVPTTVYKAPPEMNIDKWIGTNKPFYSSTSTDGSVQALTPKEAAVLRSYTTGEKIFGSSQNQPIPNIQQNIAGTVSSAISGTRDVISNWANQIEQTIALSTSITTPIYNSKGEIIGYRSAPSSYADYIETPKISDIANTIKSSGLFKETSKYYNDIINSSPVILGTAEFISGVVKGGYDIGKAMLIDYPIWAPGLALARLGIETLGSGGRNIYEMEEDIRIPLIYGTLEEKGEAATYLGASLYGGYKGVSALTGKEISMDIKLPKDDLASYEFEKAPQALSFGKDIKATANEPTSGRFKISLKDIANKKEALLSSSSVGRVLKTPEKTPLLKNVVYKEGIEASYKDLLFPPKGMTPEESFTRTRVELSPEQTEQLKNLLSSELDVNKMFVKLEVEQPALMAGGLKRLLAEEKITPEQAAERVVAHDVDIAVGKEGIQIDGSLARLSAGKGEIPEEVLNPDIAKQQKVVLQEIAERTAGKELPTTQKFEPGKSPAYYKAQAELSNLQELNKLINAKAIAEFEKKIIQQGLNLDINLAERLEGVDEYQKEALNNPSPGTKLKGSILRKAYDVAAAYGKDYIIEQDLVTGKFVLKEIRERGIYTPEQTRALKEMGRLDISGKDVDEAAKNLLSYNKAIAKSIKETSSKFPDYEQKIEILTTLKKGLPKSEEPSLGGFKFNIEGKEVFTTEGKATQVETLASGTAKEFAKASKESYVPKFGENIFQATPIKEGKFSLKLYRVIDPETGEAVRDISLGTIAERVAYKKLPGKEIFGVKLSSYISDLLDRLRKTESIEDVYKAGKKVAMELDETIPTKFIDKETSIKITETGAREFAASTTLKLSDTEPEASLLRSSSGRSVISKQPAPAEGTEIFPPETKIAETFNKADYPDLFKSKAEEITFGGQKIKIQGRLARGISSGLAYIEREVFPEMKVAGKDILGRVAEKTAQFEFLKSKISEERNPELRAELIEKYNQAVLKEMMGEGAAPVKEISLRKEAVKELFGVKEKAVDFIKYEPRDLLVKKNIGELRVEKELSRSAAEQRIKQFIRFKTPEFALGKVSAKALDIFNEAVGGKQKLSAGEANIAFEKTLGKIQSDILSSQEKAAQAYGASLRTPYNPETSKTAGLIYSMLGLYTKQGKYQAYSYSSTYNYYKPYTKYDYGYYPATTYGTYYPAPATTYGTYGVTTYTDIPYSTYADPPYLNYTEVGYPKQPPYTPPYKTQSYQPPYLPPFLTYSKEEKYKKPRTSRQAYSVFLRRRRKYLPVATGLPRGKALRFGSEAAIRSLGRTFKIVQAGETFEPEELFMPSEKIFRTYRVQKGRRVPLTNIWIQRRGQSLISKEERRALQEARRLSKPIRLTTFKSNKRKNYKGGLI